MTAIRDLSEEQYEALLAACDEIPIEQTPAWAAYESTIPGREFWGYIAVYQNGEPAAVASLMTYETHGYHFLRSRHGLVWLDGAPDDQRELAALEALAAHVRERDPKQVFMRLAVAHDLKIASPTLSTVPYDSTVIVDVTGTEEDILSRMKTRGRRDVRKALRESPAVYADETAQASASFDEYYEVMVETAARDGFTPSPKEDYENMLRILGPERCRVFAGRIDGRLATWTIATVSGDHAVRYYGASRSDVPNRNYVTDGLIFFECVTLGAEGVVDYDMMGIGSEAYPGLDTLNTFKCKFSKDIVHVAPDRDIAIKKAFYKTLVLARRVIRR